MGEWGAALAAGLISQTILLSNVNASIIPLQTSAPEVPKFDFNTADWLTPFIEAPAFWGIELTGADLAKEDIAPLHLKPVVAVVSDGGVISGAARTLDAGIQKRQPRTINLQLLVHTGLGMISPTFVERPNVKKFIKLVPTKYMPPSEMVYIDSHPSHGAHVAGLIGAGNMPFGVSSVAEIEDLNVFEGQRLVPEAALAKSYEFLTARTEPTPVLNMSHGLPLSVEVLDSLHKLVAERDTICTLASHNQGIRLSPMATPSVISDCMIVGAYGVTGTKTYFSNYGRAIDIVAPGENILSRGIGFPYKDTQIELMSGTSMATPMVSGAMTILRALLPEAKGSQLKEILYRTAIDLGKPGKDDLTGYGLINVLKAESVARRLFVRKKTSPQQIEAALKRKRFFSFKTEIAKLKFKRIQSQTQGQPLNEAVYRRELLLDGSPEALVKLADLYESKGFTRFALGIKFAALNRGQNLVDKEEMKKFARNITLLATYRMLRDPRDLVLFQSLANKDLLLGVYEAMGPNMAVAFTPEFVLQLSQIDSTATPELMTLFDQKACEISEICLNDSSKKAP